MEPASALDKPIKSLIAASDRLAGEVTVGHLSEEAAHRSMDVLNAEIVALQREQHERQVAQDLALADEIARQRGASVAVLLWVTLEDTGFDYQQFITTLAIADGPAASELFALTQESYVEGRTHWPDEFQARLDSYRKEHS